MAGLDDISPSDPNGDELLSFGDDRIRDLASRVMECISLEHNLSGEHTLPCGSIAERKAFGNRGRLFILETAGASPELHYDTGDAWVSLSRNNAVDNFNDVFAAHRTAVPIDHPDLSIRAQHIGQSQIIKDHLDGSGERTTSIADLVNGNIADGFHVHLTGGGGGAFIPGEGETITFEPSVAEYTWTCPPGITSAFVDMTGGGGGAPGRFDGRWNIPGLGLHDTVRGSIGGNGGARALQYVLVEPGKQYLIKVGRGGAKGEPNLYGGAGGQTYMKSATGEILLFANGGGVVPVSSNLGAISSTSGQNVNDMGGVAVRMRSSGYFFVWTVEAGGDVGRGGLAGNNEVITPPPSSGLPPYYLETAPGHGGRGPDWDTTDYWWGQAGMDGAFSMEIK